MGVLIFAIAMGVVPVDYNQSFTARQKYEEMRISWTVVDNAAIVCNAMMHKKAYDPTIKACAWRSGIVCEITTERNLDLAILGHEIRHCYEGKWHDE